MEKNVVVIFSSCNEIEVAMKVGEFYWGIFLCFELVSGLISRVVLCFWRFLSYLFNYYLLNVFYIRYYVNLKREVGGLNGFF